MDNFIPSADKVAPTARKKSKDATAYFNFYRSVLDGGVRKKDRLLNRRIAKFSAINLEGEIEPAKVKAYAQKKQICKKSSRC